VGNAGRTATVARKARPGARMPRQEGSDCKNEFHGASDSAWRKGCRCPRAVAAHQVVIDTGRVHRQAVRQAGREAGKCLADQHGTETALTRGCICVTPAEVRKKAAPQPGRMTAGQRRQFNKFRGPAMRVDRWNLFLILHGIVDRPTRAERLAAVVQLSRRGNRAGTGLMNSVEIGQRLGVDDATVHRARRLVIELREQRHVRRWLDAKHKAERVALAAGKAGRR